MKKLILFIIVLLPIYFVYSYNNFKNAILTPKEQILEIKKWDSYYSLAWAKFKLSKSLS